jgi:hypothetical protein
MFDLIIIVCRVGLWASFIAAIAMLYFAPRRRGGDGSEGAAMRRQLKRPRR